MLLVRPKTTVSHVVPQYADREAIVRSVLFGLPLFCADHQNYSLEILIGDLPKGGAFSKPLPLNALLAPDMRLYVTAKPRFRKNIKLQGLRWGFLVAQGFLIAQRSACNT